MRVIYINCIHLAISYHVCGFRYMTSIHMSSIDERLHDESVHWDMKKKIIL